MTEQQLIKAAIEGGWRKEDIGKKLVKTEATLVLEKALLDPKFWQAVGKVEGWGGPEAWIYKMHEMIDALADGQSISEFVKGLV